MKFKKEGGIQTPDFIEWFSELSKDSVGVAGGKGANLGEMFNLKVPVPPGFVITAQAYDYFIEKAGIKGRIKELLEEINYENTEGLNETTQKIRTLIVESLFPKEMEEEILEAYGNLSTSELETENSSALDILHPSSEPVFVAVRSSATAEDSAEASFAGQQDSFLNIKGNSELLKHIKKCFASLFTPRSTYYRNKKGFKHEEISLAVVVQKMVDSDKSGVIFSKDPTFKNDDVIIEAVWGLGEGIVSGKITPDRYIISGELEIKDKKIANKKIALTRDSSGAKIIVKLKEERSKQQVLKDYEIKKLADISIKLERHYKKPQDIEFAIEGEEIYIVQTRPITTIENRVSEDEAKKVHGEVILTGLGASPGIASGKVKIIEDLDDLKKIKEGDILVTIMTNPDMVVTMQKSAAIVTNEGGQTAHAAIISREMGIPAVVGTQEATIRLKEGEIITVDGYAGKIYKGKTSETIQKEIEPVTAITRTKMKVIVDLPTFAKRASKTNLKEAGLVRIEGIIAESGKHPEYFLKNEKMKDYEDIIFDGVAQIAKYFDELWVRTSDIRSDEFGNLEGAPKEKEANPMLGMHGIRYGLKKQKILKAELNALKRVSEHGKKIGLLLPQVISVEEIQKVKGILKQIEFKEAKIGTMIETPAAVQIIRELCTEGIEFISFGTNDLTQYILAVDRGNPEVQPLFDEMNPAVLHQLEFVIRVCKRNGVETSICGQSGSKKEMVKFLVKKGIDSISVNADMAKEISDYVAEIEKEIGESPREYQPELPKIKGAEEDFEEFREDDLEAPTYIVKDENIENAVLNKNNIKEDENSDEENKDDGNNVKEEIVEENKDNRENIEETGSSNLKQDLENIEQLIDDSNEKRKFSNEDDINDEGSEYLQGEEAIEATEEEKREYLKKHPREEEIPEELEEDNESSEEYETAKKGKQKEEILDIF